MWQLCPQCGNRTDKKRLKPATDDCLCRICEKCADDNMDTGMCGVCDTEFYRDDWDHTYEDEEE